MVNRKFYPAALAFFLTGGLYGWSGLIPALNERFGSSAGDAGMVFSLAVATFTTALLLTPLLPEKLQGARGIGFACVLGAVMLAVAANSNSFVVFMVAFSLGFGAASGCIYILGLSIASKARRSVLLTSILIAFFGTGGAVLGPLFRFAPGPLDGLEVLYWLSGAMFCCATLAFVAGDGKAGQVEPRKKVSDARRLARQGDLWKIWAVFCLGAMAGLMVIGLASSMVEGSGGSVLLSGIAISAIAVANSVGRLSVGFLPAWLNAKSALQVALSIVLAGLVLAGMYQGGAIGVVGLVLIGLGYGMLASAIPALVQSVFGDEDFSLAFALVFTGWGVAGLCSSWIAGSLFDNHGSFLPAIVLAAFATVIVLVILWRMKTTQNSSG